MRAEATAGPVRPSNLDESSPGPLRRRLNLTRELAFTQFKLKYTGSVLGYLWSLLKPLMIFGIMYIVFTKLLRIQANTPHFPLQLLLGIVVWSFFAETVSNAVGVVVANGALLKKAYFPRPILVLASSISALMTFAINTALIIVIALPLGQVQLGLRSLSLFPLVAELYALILGLSFALAAFFVFYRDLGHLWEVSSQLLFYGSAVVYPLTPEFLGSKAKLLALNPIAQMIEDARHAIVTPVVPWTASILGGAVAAVPFAIVGATLAIGYLTFMWLSPRFAEYL